MGRSFSKEEREIFRQKLIDACCESWTKHGYKKTSVDDLCKQVGISKGGFYLFFSSKEELFGEVLCLTQKRIYENAANLIMEQKNKEGVIAALKYIYREYDRNNFLQDSCSSDFSLLAKKLSAEQLIEIEKFNDLNHRLFLEIPHLRLKVSENMAASVIYSLVMGMKSKEVLPSKHQEVFEFMAKHLIDDLYE